MVVDKSGKRVKKMDHTVTSSSAVQTTTTTELPPFTTNRTETTKPPPTINVTCCTTTETKTELSPLATKGPITESTKPSPTINVEIVVPAIGGAVVLCLVVVVVVICMLRKRKKNKNTANSPSSCENSDSSSKNEHEYNIIEDVSQSHFTVEETGDVYALVQKGQENTITTKIENTPLPNDKPQHSVPDNITVPSSPDSGDVCAQVQKQNKTASANQTKLQSSPKTIIKEKPTTAEPLEYENIPLETDIAMYVNVRASEPTTQHPHGRIYDELQFCERNEDNKAQSKDSKGSDTEDNTIFPEDKITEM